MFKQFKAYGEGQGCDFSISRATLFFRHSTLDRQFKESYFESNLQIGRACHLIAIFFYTVVGMLDAILVDPSRLTTWIWVICAVSLIFVLGLIASYKAKNYYSRYWQQLFAFYVLMTGSGFTIVTVASRPNYPVYNIIGIIFCLFFCYTFIRLTFLWAALAGNTIVVLYTIATVVFVNPSANLMLIGFFYMFGINTLGMMVCYSLELMSRRDFMLNCLLKNAENQTRQINLDLEQLVLQRTREMYQTNQELKISIQREKQLVAKLENEEKILQKSLTSLEQAESLAKLGYFERNWQTGQGYWSKGFFKLLKEKNADAVLSHDQFMAFIHEDDKNRVIQHIKASIEKHESMDVEFKLRQADGAIVQIHGIADNYYSDDGRPLITRGIFQDITDHKLAQQALKKMERQLVQAQKMESVGRLAGGVAHDYNNISGIIVGYAELALDKVDPQGSLHNDLSEILAAARRSSDLTRQLLAFARKQTVAPKVLDLNEVIGGMLKMLKRLIGEDIDIAWLPGPNIWPIRIDPSQIDQILANLSVNARDAIADVGKVTVETNNISFDAGYCADHAGFIPGDFVSLAVSDDGSGIAPENIDQVFEPFFTTKEVGRGTGLGLATVYGIIKQNNGFINIYSELKNGTTIKIYLPRHQGRSLDAFDQNKVTIPTGRGETILLVEDDGPILRLGARLLEGLGYAVLFTSSPVEAIKLASAPSVAINLLITDVIMPEMNGRELALHLQKQYPGLKVLFMSGYTANVIAHRGVLDQDVCFLSKPFSKSELAVKVRETLDHDNI